MIDNSAFPLLCTELLRSGQSVRFRATGASMSPTIRDGDTITISPLEQPGVRVEDVILYNSTRGLTAHRVVEILHGSSALITQGDAPDSPRERVEPSALLGRVESVERDGNRIPAAGPLGRQLTRLAQLVVRVSTLSSRRASRRPKCS